MNFEVFYDEIDERWYVRLKDRYGVVVLLSVNGWEEREGAERELEMIAEGVLGVNGDVPVVVQLGEEVGAEVTRLSEFA